MDAADLLLSGGTIWRGRGLPKVEALAIAGGRVVAAGTRLDMLDFCGPGTRRVDLGGGCALPAFNDPHLHLATLGFSLGELNLRGGTRESLLAQVSGAVDGTAPGAWITGRGYDEATMDGTVPSLAELDAASPNNPVLLRRVCGHQFLVNSAGLALAGIENTTPDPAGGVIVRRERRATGLLLEEAGQLAVRAMPRPGLAEFQAAVAGASKVLITQGITSVMDAAVGRAGYDELLALTTMAESGALALRTWVCLYGGAGGVLERAYTEGLRFGTEIGRLRFGAAKLFADGSVGGATAAFREPYVAGGNGLLGYADDEMHGLLRRFHDLGYQLAIHAIGDAAIEQVLRGMEALPEGEVRGRRHRIEHCGFATLDQLKRMKARGIFLVPQPSLVTEFGDRFATLLGRERADAAYPMRLWNDMGFAISASSDAPICPSNPMTSIVAMIERRTASGTVFGPDQRLDLETALDAQTRGGAVAQFAEDRLGTLQAGMTADVAVLSGDPFVEGTDLKTLHVVTTIQGGDLVHNLL